MKTIYQCEICGKNDFKDWEECHKHEKACEELHASGKRIAGKINDFVADAETVKAVSGDNAIFFGVGSCGDKNTVYKLLGAVYDTSTRTVFLDIDTDEEKKVWGREELIERARKATEPAEGEK